MSDTDAVCVCTTISIARSSSGSSSGSNSPLVVLALDRQLGGLEQRLVEVLTALRTALLDDERDLLLAHVRALKSLQTGGSERLEEHVALAEEALGAGRVEDHARVGLARDGERDPRGHVRLDHPGDDVHRRALRREHEVDADRARLLREPDHAVLDRLRRDHHQVGELVDDHEQVRQRRLPAGAERPVRLRAGCARGRARAARSVVPSPRRRS